MKSKAIGRLPGVSLICATSGLAFLAIIIWPIPQKEGHFQNLLPQKIYSPNLREFICHPLWHKSPFHSQTNINLDETVWSGVYKLSHLSINLDDKKLASLSERGQRAPEALAFDKNESALAERPLKIYNYVSSARKFILAPTIAFLWRRYGFWWNTQAIRPAKRAAV